MYCKSAPSGCLYVCSTRISGGSSMQSTQSVSISQHLSCYIASCSKLLEQRSWQLLCHYQGPLCTADLLLTSCVHAAATHQVAGPCSVSVFQRGAGILSASILLRRSSIYCKSAPLGCLCTQTSPLAAGTYSVHNQCPSLSTSAATLPPLLNFAGSRDLGCFYLTEEVLHVLPICTAWLPVHEQQHYIRCIHKICC